jgi:hypothetical protein
MRRLAESARAGVPALTALVLLPLAGSCTSQPVILPSQDFNRPTDIVFVCTATVGSAAASPNGVAIGTPGAEVLTGRPMRECHPRGFVDVPDTIHRTFAFLPNSAGGTLSVIDTDTWSFVNLEPGNSSFNPLPIGVIPTQIAASDDGCRLVTANHGSCDLSFIDPAAVLAPTVEQMLSSTTQSAVTSSQSTLVTTVVPITQKGHQLRLLAGEVSFLSTDTSPTAIPAVCPGDPDHTCPGGAACPQWQVLATFPSCDLVALLALPSGVIQQAAYVRKTADGSSVELVQIPDGQDPVCPVDCTNPLAEGSAAAPSDGSAGEAGPDAGVAEAGEAGTPEAGVAEGGGSEAGTSAEVEALPVDPGDVAYIGPGALRPGPIAIVPQSNRAYVGLGNAAFVLAFDVAPNQFVPGTSNAIELHEGALGVNRVRLSIDPYKDQTVGGGFTGSFVGDDSALSNGNPVTPNNPDAVYRQYLYVIARDGSLRVVQVSPLKTPETECETNTDFSSIMANADTPNNARTQAMRAAICPPVVGAAGRRPDAVGPGFHFPTPPVDVAAIDIRPDPPDNSEISVTGAHAWVLTASGSVYLVNIDPVLRNINWVLDADATNSVDPVLACATPQTGMCYTEPDPAPNTLRNESFLGYTAALDPSMGPARLDEPPAESSLGPRILSVWTRGSAANATALTSDYNKTWVYFPDQQSITPQVWTLSWEGNLFPSPRFTGQLVPDTIDVYVAAFSSPTSSVLQDVGVDFCRTGVQVNDLVTITGCTDNTQCGIGQYCAMGSNGAQGAGGLPITGLCISPSLDMEHCVDLLSTIKRYEVTATEQNRLVIVPHKDELVRPALNPCHPAEVVAADGGAEAGADGGSRDADAGGADGKLDGGDAGTLIPDDCPDPTDPSTTGFTCVDQRCLYPCKVAGETTGCRVGRICVPFGRPDCTDGQCFCADGPPIGGANLDPNADANACLGELFSYQVGVGRGFAVSGSTTGLPATGQANPTSPTGLVCEPIPGLDPRSQIRISMDAPACTGAFAEPTVPGLDSRCDPSLTDPECPAVDNAILGTADGGIADRMLLAQTAHAKPLQDLLETPNLPNACLFIAGPNDADPPNASPTHVSAAFRNSQLQFMLTNLDRGPTGVFEITFDVHGGFLPQTVVIPPTVQVSMPARMVVGPFDANNPPNPTAPIATQEVPYFFVVDQRRLGTGQGGGPTRGQLLRIHPRGDAVTTPATGEQPWYEDLTHSNNLFPMQ